MTSCNLSELITNIIMTSEPMWKQESSKKLTSNSPTRRHIRTLKQNDTIITLLLELSIIYFNVHIDQRENLNGPSSMSLLA